MNKLTFLFLFSLILVACEKEESTNIPENKVVMEDKTLVTEVDKPKEKLVKSITNGKIGIAICDEYIKKYEECVNKKVPETVRVSLKEPFDKMRSQWEKMAQDSTMTEVLKVGCKRAFNVSKKIMQVYGCDF